MNILNSILIFIIFHLIHLAESHQSCKHDAQNQEIHVEQNEGIETNKARLLVGTSREPIRITSDFSFLSSIAVDKQNHIKALFNVAKKFYIDLLKVTPRSTNLLFPNNSNTCGNQITVQSTDQTVGISNSDIHFYITSVDTSSSNYIAYAGACILEGSTNRPIFAYIVYNLHYMTYTAGDKYTFSRDLDTTIHEMMHALGFSSSLYQYFLSDQGGVYDPAVYSTQFKIMGTNQLFLQTPHIVTAARNHFNCPTLEGMPLENEGSTGSASSHWERTAVYNDIMGASDIYQRATFTIFDAALLKDTGWYDVNDSMAEDVDWGKGKGCDFIYKACQDASFTEFCTTDKQCDFTNQNPGDCSIDTFSSGCKIQQAYSNMQCQNDKSTNLDSKYHFQFGWESRCLASTLYEDASLSSSDYYSCYKTSCDSASTKISISVGSYTVECDSNGGLKDLSGQGFTGELKCPTDIQLFCNNSYTCSNFCSENGYCNHNKCVCLDGYLGAGCDCQDFLENDVCVPSCSVGRTANSKKICLPSCVEGDAIQNCKTCDSGTNLCSVCQDSYYLDSNSQCQQCSADCALCTDNLTCTKCTNGKVLQGKICKTACDHTYVNVNDICVQCLLNCDTCSDASKCDTCVTSYYLFNSKTQCIATCPSNTYINGQSCSDCDLKCNECTGPTNSDCKKCEATKFKSGSLCVDSCSSTQYSITNGTDKECKGCASDCLSCTSDIQCTSCSTLNLQDGICQSTCNVGYFPDTQVCKQCPSGCKACTALNQCTDCGTQLIQDGICKATCDSGYYQSSPNLCKKCISNCAECSDSSTCTKCVSSFYLQGSICKNNCSSGYYGDSNKKCQKCDTSCEECTGPSSSECSSCVSPKKLYRFTCVNPCPVNTYSNPIMCLDCDQSCTGCTGSSNTDCQVCAPGYTNSPGPSCTKINCGSGQFYDTVANSCAACDTNCKECQGISKCLICLGSQVSQGGICKANCDAGYYPNSSLLCIPCITGCDNCSNSLTCTTCSNTTVNQAGICQSSCDTGFYANSSKKCLACNSNCATCSGSSATDCSSCLSGQYFYNNTCLSDCPPKTYKSTFICQNCHISCNTCSGSLKTDCTTCATGYQKSGSTCVSTVTCTSGQYLDTDGVTCRNCGNQCQVCSSNSTCTNCNVGYYNQDGLCQTQCNTGYYSSASNICIKCSQYCNQCNASGCTKCQSGYFIQSGVCQISCNSGYYSDSNGYCQSCGVNCQSCGNNTSCQVCNSGFVNQRGVCQSSCNKTFYPDAGKYCQNCISNCDQCSSSSYCDTCSSGYVKQAGLCKQQCDSNYYLDSYGVCQICHSSCATCYGSSSSSCLTCNIGQKIYQNTCYASCPIYTYQLPDKISCGSCNIACDGCYGPTDSDCFSCALLYVKLEQSCKDKCYDNQYVVNRICYDCDSYCQRCTGSGQCTQCQQGFVLQGGICQLKCNDGSYNSGGICQQCAPNCKTCDSQLATECGSCLGTYLLYKNTCIATCDGNRYLSTDSTQCLDCNPVCDGCYGGNTDDKCNGCVAAFKMFGGRCISRCSSGNFYSGTTCNSCPAGCSECINNTQCVKCQSGLFLQNGSCKSICDSGYYTNSNSECIKCYSRCLTCNGPNRDQCILCSSSFKLYEGQCLDDCPSKTYNESNACLKCDQSCLTCSNQKADSCGSCDPTYFKYGSQCVVSCGQNQFTNKNRECIDCAIGCTSCKSTSICQVCSSGYIMSSGICIKSNDTKRNPNCHFSCKTCIGSEYNQCTTCMQTRYLSVYYTSSLSGECVCIPDTTDVFKSECADSSSAEQQRKAQVASTSISSSISFIASSLAFQAPMFIQIVDFQQTIGTLSYINKKNAMQYDETTNSMRKLNLNYLIPSPFSDSNTFDAFQTKRLLSSEGVYIFQNKISQTHGSDSFLVNGFILFLFNLITFVIMIFAILSNSLNSSTDQKNMFYKICSYLSLTFPTFFLLITITELSVCVILQFMLYDISFSDHKVAGLVLAVFSLLYIIAFIVLVFYMAYSYPQKIKEYNYLYIQQFMSLLKTEKFLQRAHYGVLIIKKLIQAIIIVTLYFSPIACISILFSLEVLFTIYLCFLLPFNSRNLNIITVFSSIGQTVIYLIFLISTAGDQTDSYQQSGCVLALVVVTNVILYSYTFFMIYVIITSIQSLFFKRKDIGNYEQQFQQTTQYQVTQNNMLTQPQQLFYQNTEQQLHDLMVKLNNNKQTSKIQNNPTLFEEENYPNKYMQNMQSYYQQKNLQVAFSNSKQKLKQDIQERNKKSPIRMFQQQSVFDQRFQNPFMQNVHNNDSSQKNDSDQL